MGMKIEKAGYKFKGFELGQRIILFGGEQCDIIGFLENHTDCENFILADGHTCGTKVGDIYPDITIMEGCESKRAVYIDETFVKEIIRTVDVPLKSPQSDSKIRSKYDELISLYATIEERIRLDKAELEKLRIIKESFEVVMDYTGEGL